jgi:predicted aspartyl protease
MASTSFDPSGDLIVVAATVSGPLGIAQVRLAVDTGSAATVLVPDVLDELGYSPRDGRGFTTVTTAVGQEQGYLLRVHAIEALGFTEYELPVHVFDLASRIGIDGLIGLNFLERFNYEIRSAEGRIHVQRIAG